MKLARLIKLMYNKFKIDFSGVHTVSPNYFNKTAHFILRLYKVRLRRFKRNKRRPRYIHKFYRQFIYKYIYRVDINKPRKRKKRYKWWFVSRRIARLFYLTYKYKQFRLLGARLVRREGSWSSALAMALECRILTFLYRMQISFDIFELKRLALMGIASISDKLPKHSNYLVPICAFVVLSADWRQIILSTIRSRVFRKRIFFSIPRFMILSYKFFYAFIWKHPSYPGDFAYPFLRKTSGRFKKHILVDLYRGLDISYI